MTCFHRGFERQRQEQMTPERIVQIAKSAKRFGVSLRYRDDWLRRRCAKLKSDGLLVGGRRDGSELVYYPAQQAPQCNMGDQTNG